MAEEYHELLKEHRDLLEFERVIRDPIYDYIPLTKLECAVIDTAAFQRLDRIGQMHSVYKVYPSGAYSRKVHSLGATHLTGQAISRIIFYQDSYVHKLLPSLLYSGNQTSRDNKEFLDELGYIHAIPQKTYELEKGVLQDIDKDEYVDEFVEDYTPDRIADTAAWYIQVARLSGLLHDCGHGPFSHLLENLDELDFDHEKQAIDIVEHIQEKLSDKIVEEYGDRGVDFTNPIFELSKLVVDKDTDDLAELAYLGELINSPWDCDMLDYIVRDSYFTGTSEYGLADTGRIIHGLVVKDDSLRMSETASGAVFNAFESLFSMYREVYHHNTSRMYSLILKQALNDYSDNLDEILGDTNKFMKYGDRDLLAKMKLDSCTDDDLDKCLNKIRAFENREKPYMILDSENFVFDFDEVDYDDPVDDAMEIMISELNNFRDKYDEDIVVDDIYSVRRVGLGVSDILEWTTEDLFYDPSYVNEEEALKSFYQVNKEIRDRLKKMELPALVFIDRNIEPEQEENLKSDLTQTTFPLIRGKVQGMN